MYRSNGGIRDRDVVCEGGAMDEETAKARGRRRGGGQRIVGAGWLCIK